MIKLVKKTIGILFGIVVFILAVIGVIALVYVYKYTFGFKNYVYNTDAVINSASIEEDFNQALPQIGENLKYINSIVAKEYLFDVELTDIESSIYKGFVDGLGDEYSVYYTPEEFSQLMEDTSGKYSGIGAIVTQDRETKVIKILKVFEGSPSKEAGLLPNDILYKVDGVEIANEDLDLLVKKYIRGEEGSSLTLTVLRGEHFDEVDLKITRRYIEVPTVEYKMLEDNIAYIQVSQFDTVTDEQFESAVNKALSEGAKAINIDLRNNPGGDLETVINMLDLVLPDGMVMYTKDKYDNESKYYSDDGKQIEVPMNVLVNEYSASASEVFTGAFKDFKYGNVIGKKSFGKGIVQEVIPFANGGGLKITTQHYYTPSGFDLHKKGITPDIEVDMKISDINTDKDIQLQEAIKDLKNKIK